MLTLFFGTCQEIGERKEYQVENDAGAQKEGIGHGLVPIRRLSIFFGKVLIRDDLGLEGGVFYLFK